MVHGEPQGIEQGFTIPAPPPCRQRGGRGVVVALGGGLAAVVSADGRAATLHDASGAEVLRYTDLHVVDAAGRELDARLEARGGGLAIRFDDTGARYLVEVDPMMWVEQAELTTGDGGLQDAFGASVALSGDTAIVGELASASSGVAAVYVRAGASWVQQAALSAIFDTMVGSHFGAQVAVNGDLALVGGVNDAAQGAAFFFARSGTTWTPRQEVNVAAPEVLASFGSALALSADTAIVGAPGTTSNAAYVYVLSGTTWSLQQVLTSGATADGGPPDAFGSAVALSGDTVLVGAPSGVQDAGAVYVFVRSGTTWSLQQQLTAPDGTGNDAFGASVAIFGDALLVGAPLHGGAGAAYFFTRSGTTWTVQQELFDASADVAFGASVALGASSAAVGTSELKGDGIQVFALSGGILTLEATLTPSVAQPGEGFGSTVALDGTTIVTGSPHALGGAGAAFVFDMGSSAGDTCTSDDACASGYCVDGVCCATPTCQAAGPCNAAETCQPATGMCSVTPIHDGMACDQGDLCMKGATCQGGICAGGSVSCAPADDCHEFGVCDPTTGSCSSPAKADGQQCSSGVCMGGVCVPDAATDGGLGGGERQRRGWERREPAECGVAAR